MPVDTRTTATPPLSRRVVSIWFPFWSIDLLRRRWQRRAANGASRGESRPGHGDHRRPVLLTQPQQGREVVAAACPLATARGVKTGMPLANARALVHGDAIVATWMPERDAESLRALAIWCNRFSPTVGIDPPDGLVLDVTGTQRLHKGERRLLMTIRHAMERMGLRSRVAIASTIGCAGAMARYAREACSLVSPGDEARSLARMPPEALNLSKAHTQAMKAMGFERLDSLMNLPRSSLPARFGPEVLERLDAALGRRVGVSDMIDVIEPIRPCEPIIAERRFDGPTTHWESVEACAAALVEELMATLASRHAGVRRLEACLMIANRRPPVRLMLTLCRPCRDGLHVWSMLRPHLERVHLGDGIEGMRLAATRIAAMHHVQCSFTAPTTVATSGTHSHGVLKTDPAEACAALSDTLMSRLGVDAVAKVFHVESHVPERAFRLVSVMHSHRHPGETRAITTPRPSCLFLQPEPVQVMHVSPDGPIHRMHWRDRLWHVTTCIGPERIGGRWWLHVPGDGCADRDYYRLCIACEGLDPRWVWVYRLSPCGTWHAHGEWA
jgi:protein ImuB